MTFKEYKELMIDIKENLTEEELIKLRKEYQEKNSHLTESSDRKLVEKYKNIERFINKVIMNKYHADELREEED